MNGYEKLGLWLCLFYFTNYFPDYWRGAEGLIGIIGWTLFFWGKKIDDILKLR